MGHPARPCACRDTARPYGATTTCCKTPNTLRTSSSAATCPHLPMSVHQCSETLPCLACVYLPLIDRPSRRIRATTIAAAGQHHETSDPHSPVNVRRTEQRRIRSAIRDPRGHTDEARDTATVSDMRIDVMLSMMRALWEQGTSDLRGPTVYWVGSAESGSIAARFLYEGAVE